MVRLWSVRIRLLKSPPSLNHLRQAMRAAAKRRVVPGTPGTVPRIIPMLRPLPLVVLLHSTYRVDLPAVINSALLFRNPPAHHSREAQVPRDLPAVRLFHSRVRPVRSASSWAFACKITAAAIPLRRVEHRPVAVLFQRGPRRHQTLLFQALFPPPHPHRTLHLPPLHQAHLLVLFRLHCQHPSLPPPALRVHRHSLRPTARPTLLHILRLIPLRSPVLSAVHQATRVVNTSRVSARHASMCPERCRMNASPISVAA